VENHLTTMNNNKDYTIASGTIFYNDCKSLERTLESLKDKVDYMICIDGKFKHFKDANPSSISNDGSAELVASYKNAIYWALPDRYEIEKRQKYLEICRNAGVSDGKIIPGVDYLLIVDSDEYVIEYDKDVFEGELSRLHSDRAMAQYNVFAVMLEVNSGKYEHIVHKFANANAGPPQPSRERQYAHSPRLWHRPYEMEYNVTHYNFRNKHPASSLHYLDTNPAVKIIPGLKLGHDHILRSNKFLNSRFTYQKWLVDFEQNKLKTYQHKTKLTPKIRDYDSIDHDNNKPSG
jgi:hypothetical protein